MAKTQRTCTSPECDAPAYCRKLCQKHYTRLRVHGDINVVLPSHSPINPWDYIECRGADECWPWTGNLDRDGYGHFSIKQKNWIASRWVLAQKVNDLRPDEVTRHTCDNRICCNPAHLLRGTPADNVRDMTGRQRHIHGDKHWAHKDATKVQGSNNGEAKLTETDVLELRRIYAAGGARQVDLADQFGITQGMVSSIIRRASWKHI